MKRQDKYPDTDTYHFYNANPHNKFTDDCVIRALSTAMEQSWKDTFNDLCQISLKYGVMPTDTKCFSRYLKQNGWIKQSQPRKRDNTKYTGKEFIKEILYDNAPYTNIIAKIGGHHIVAIINGKVYDTWDSTEGCIGNYWIQG